MMYKDKILEYFHSRLDRVEQNYRQALGNADPEGVHQVRVENKRLRGLFRLVGAIVPGFKAKKRFKKFRRLSKSTSLLRDSHVQYLLTAELESSHGIDAGHFKRFLRSRNEKGLRKFIDYSQKHDAGKLREAAGHIAAALDSIDRDTAEARAIGRLSSMTGKLLSLERGSVISEEFMHDVRKLSKETDYTMRIIRDCLPACKQPEQLRKSLKSVHKVLGRWHDFQVCLEFFDDFRDECPEIAAAENYLTFETVVMREKNRLRQRFGKAFDRFHDQARSMD